MSDLQRRFLPVVLTLVLLGAVAAETLSRPRPQEAEPFHQRVREVCKGIPTVIGDWERPGTEDIAIPPAAVALLRPNVMVHRRFINRSTHRVADLLLVQCRDARDMAGHYPPVCYPAHGWTTMSRTAVQWEIGGRTIPGMEYEFLRTEGDRSVACIVSNVFVLPDGRFVREMEDIRKLADDYLRQFYGAAQIQVVVDAAVPANERREIFRELIGANVPVLDALCSGGTK